MNISIEKTQVTEPLDYIESKGNQEVFNKDRNMGHTLPMVITPNVG